uniref:helix-turn-helix domain-containing protein n=1 Tax=Enterobacter kobei TaxID=208224 RepID=UPI002B002DD9
SDIMLLADQFAIQMCRELGLPLFPGFSDYAKETLLAYHWPGNTPSSSDHAPALPLDLRQFQHDQEQQLLEQSLKTAKYNQKRAAELLGLTYHQLRALLKKHQMR